MNSFTQIQRIIMVCLIPGSIFLSASLQGQQSDHNFGDPWERHVIDERGSGADGVKLSDVNGDGFTDIVTGWEESGVTRVYLHPGTDQVRSPWEYIEIGQTPSVEDAAFMDVNFDGFPDVVTCSEGETNSMSVHFAPESETVYSDGSQWRSEVIPASQNMMQWMYAVPASFRADDALDIVAAGKNDSAAIGYFRIPENPANMNEYRWHPLAEVSWVMSIRVLDVDSDNDLDILYTDRKGTRSGCRWLENPGMMYQLSANWQEHTIGGIGEEVMFLDISDPDKKGMRTIYIAVLSSEQQYIISLQQLSNDGLRWKRRDIPIPDGTGTGKAVAIGDINLDGRDDLVYSCENADAGKSGVIWLENSRRIFIQRWHPAEISGPTGIKYDRIELEDLDDDGDLDVIICEENAGDQSQGLGVIWYENPVH